MTQPRAMRSSRGRQLLACCLPLVACSLALGQRSQAPISSSSESKPDIKIHGMSEGQLREMLTARNREFLYPGKPLVVVGNEEGDNDFRSNTPLLVGAHKVDFEIDMDDAYQRRLAMYDNAAVFHSPPVALVEATPIIDRSAPTRASTRRSTQQPEEPIEEESSIARYFKWGAILSLLAAAWAKRHDLVEALT